MSLTINSVAKVIVAIKKNLSGQLQTIYNRLLKYEPLISTSYVGVTSNIGRFVVVCPWPLNQTSF